MEYTQWEINNKQIIDYGKVLILVVMEYTQWGGDGFPSYIETTQS